MIRCTLTQAALWAGGELHATQDLTIHGVSTDSRTVGPGNLFVPLEGPKFDGHAYVRDVFGQGAAASLWRKGAPNPPVGLPLIVVEDTLAALQRLAQAYRQNLGAIVVGITGSNGKTSTKDILAGILSTAGKTQKTRGNLNNHIGVPLTILDLEEDTRYAVVEMGMSAPGEIALLASIAKPTVGIITGVGHAHLEQMGSLEAIASAKWEIASAIGKEGLLIYHGDNALLRRCAVGATIPTRTFGEEPGKDARLGSFVQGAWGITFTVEGGRAPFSLPMQGKHNALNALAAMEAALFLGLSWDKIAAGLARVEPTGSRCQVVRAGEFTIIDDTYKSNLESVLAALEVLYGAAAGRKLFVMGDMVDLGVQRKVLHRQIGEALDPQRLDAVFACGSDTVHTIDAAKARFPSGKACHFESQEELLQALAGYMSEPCAVLIKASHSRHFEDIALWLRQHLEARNDV